MNLGLIVRNGAPVNHRSVLKVMVNPFLRVVGLQVATAMNPLGADPDGGHHRQV